VTSIYVIRDNDCDTDLRIEFCKSKASADRWREEVELLREEMARTKRFFQVSLVRMVCPCE